MVVIVVLRLANIMIKPFIYLFIFKKFIYLFLLVGG